MKRLPILIILLCVMPLCVHADLYTDDFSGGLSNWTAGPSHLDGYGIVGGELFLNGKGHLTGTGGWGVLQFNQALGSSFVATWNAKITYYDYANFTLAADSPWGFNSSLGYTDNGYLGWMDIDDPAYPIMDVHKRISGIDTPLTTSMSVTPDIPENQWFSWKVAMDMGNLKVYVDDALYVDVYDATFANSNFKIGLSFGEDSQGYIDNFQVDVVPVPGAALLGIIGMATSTHILRRRKRTMAA